MFGVLFSESTTRKLLHSLPVCNFGPIRCVSVSGHNLVVVPFGRSEFVFGSVSTYLFAPRGVWGVSEELLNLFKSFCKRIW